eukprot:TRINITY_DN5080_c0_g1_i1.p1 TRINITY_DN5080_c0_g1~~TRINITY_DN5080_c0_g1_i1.p1  ORF type:complete len:151 (+),score=24.79 TRINITY_DN5080_c0_g1_i1:88-540(+)
MIIISAHSYERALVWVLTLALIATVLVALLKHAQIETLKKNSRELLLTQIQAKAKQTKLNNVLLVDRENSLKEWESILGEAQDVMHRTDKENQYAEECQRRVELKRAERDEIKEDDNYLHSLEEKIRNNITQADLNLIACQKKIQKKKCE